MRTTKPRIRLTPFQPEGDRHGLARTYPAVRQAVRRPAADAGFGTAAGRVRECKCGRQYRSGLEFARHLDKETIMRHPLTFLNAQDPTFLHRLTDTARNGRILICTCGRTFMRLTVMQEHIRHANGQDPS